MTIGKLDFKLEKLRDKAEELRDKVAECKLELISARAHDDEAAADYKDTHVDLSMEMWILHNKTTPMPTTTSVTYSYTTTTYAPPKQEKGSCLLTYYGYTNETCW